MIKKMPAIQDNMGNIEVFKSEKERNEYLVPGSDVELTPINVYVLSEDRYHQITKDPFVNVREWENKYPENTNKLSDCEFIKMLKAQNNAIKKDLKNWDNAHSRA